MQLSERDAVSEAGSPFRLQSTVNFGTQHWQLLVQEDEDATDEARFLLVGMSTTGHLLTVCYTLRGELIRLISARMATKNERRQYES